MATFRVLTLRFWAFVVGIILPLLLAATYSLYRTDRILDDGSGVTPWYPVALLLGMGLPPLLLIGVFLSFAVQRPRSAGWRFGIGVAVGTTLMVAGDSDLLRF